MAPSVTMILCVSRIIYAEVEDVFDHQEENTSERVIMGMEVTDGWYRAQCQIDDPLKRAIKNEKVKIGTKIATNGARVRK